MYLLKYGLVLWILDIVFILVLGGLIRVYSVILLVFGEKGKFYVWNLNVEWGKFGRNIFLKYYEDCIIGFDFWVVCSGVFMVFWK